jgi:O-antigen/teichoic acid export membrane protein
MGSSFLRMAAQLSIIFLFSRKLSLKDYGLYQLVWLYINIISVISLFGLPSLLLSVSVKNITDWVRANKKQFLLWAGLLNLIPLTYIFFEATNYDVLTRLLLIFLIISQSISIIVETLAIKNEKEILVFTTNILFTIGYLFCHLLLLYINYSLHLLLTGLILFFWVKIFLQRSFSTRNLLHRAHLPAQQISKQWFYLGLNDVVGVLSKWLDKWVILFFVSVTQFAVYFNGAYEVPVFGLMLSAIGNVMLVDFSKNHTDIVAATKSLFNNSVALLSGIVFPSFCFLLFYHTPFFTLIFGTKYQEAIPVFLVSIFVLPVRITNFTALIQTYNRNDLIVKGAVLDILAALVLMLLLYPVLQMKGLALAFVIATYIQAVYYLWHTGKLLHKKISYFFPFKKLLITMLISFIVTGTGYFIFNSLLYPSNLIAGIILCVLTVLAFMYNYYKSDKHEASV